MKLTIETKVTKLRNALKAAALQLEEASCTCVDRSKGHQRGCVGISQAQDYFRLVKRSRTWK